MKIVLAGGGTGGSATPLLAVANDIKNRFPETDFLFIGTGKGPEGELARKQNFGFQTIYSGKLRRYASWKNLIDPLFVIAGFLQSLIKLKKYKPDVIFSAGGFVSVPIIWAGWLLNIPSLIHQQDVEPGLSNRLVQGVVNRITVTFEHSLRDFPPRKTIWAGNPIRPELLSGDRQRGQRIFNLKPGLPTVLVFGGGTGAQKINELMVSAIFKLTKYCQIIHIFGRKKVIYNIKDENYHGYEFLISEMKDAYAAADIVVCRAGLGSLTEIAALSKPAIIIPMPNTHQVANAALYQRANAAVVLDQTAINSDFLVNVILGLLANKDWQSLLSRNVSKLIKLGARTRLANELIALIK